MTAPVCSWFPQPWRFNTAKGLNISIWISSSSPGCYFSSFFFVSSQTLDRFVRTRPNIPVSLFRTEEELWKQSRQPAIRETPPLLPPALLPTAYIRHNRLSAPSSVRNRHKKPQLDPLSTVKTTSTTSSQIHRILNGYSSSSNRKSQRSGTNTTTAQSHSNTRYHPTHQPGSFLAVLQ